MKNNPIVSVIVPVYNVETYIEECLDSIVKQNYPHLEIIVVDDGSTDDSNQLVKNYLEDERILFIEQENKGLSGARNSGLKKATGKYILFVDSDDYIGLTMLENLVSLMEESQADLVRFNGAAFVDGMEKTADQDYYDFSHRLQEKKIYQEDSFRANSRTFVSPVYLYLMKRSILTEHDLWFREDIIHEDELFTPQVFLSIQSMVYVNAFYYYRRYRENSIMTIQSPAQQLRSFTSYLKIFKELELLYQSDTYNKEQKKLIKRQMLSIYNGLKENQSEAVSKNNEMTQIKTITLKDKSYLMLQKLRNRV
ncbi:glycosyltransferase [Carnobacterium sp. CS13]|uniref:glycosyltransferase family 2 protein n=1 Tax=Carnobacterium sp. CS13 TaxID=2800128 RepID=UPI001911C96B|nr:glycosyltransferase [Carnobacterium sp. CS13]QQP69593.1 glycosyltransferase [Carnobacterium sp. CS13]